MFCHKCGAQIGDGAVFCHRCGTKVVYGNDGPQRADPPRNAGGGEYERVPAMGQKDGETGQKPEEKACPQSEPAAGHGPSKSKSWWDGCSKVKKVFAVAAALLAGGFALYVLVAFLREFGYLLFGAAVIGGFVIMLKTGSEKEKIETRKAIAEMVVGFVFVCIIAAVVVLKPDLVSDIIKPGAGVRDAYLTQYSDEVTVEKAFQDFFANEKWSTYRSDGYSYVVFTGVCEYEGKRADARITFKITGENFRVDRLDINGTEQSNLMLALMLEKIYEDY